MSSSKISNKMSNLGKQYYVWACQSFVSESVLNRYAIYLECWDDDITLKEFDEWLDS